MKGHETANGVGPIDAVDEFYFNIHYHPKALPLGTATPDEKNLVRINNIWTRDGYLAKGKSQALLWGLFVPMAVEELALQADTITGTGQLMGIGN